MPGGRTSDIVLLDISVFDRVQNYDWIVIVSF